MTDDLIATVWINGERVTLVGDEVREAMRTNALPHRLESSAPAPPPESPSPARERLMTALEARGFEREVPFRGQNGRRRFRFDAAHERLRIAVDFHGFGGGAAHTFRGSKAGDYDKVNESQLCGWCYLICDAITVNAGRCLEQIDTAMTQATERGR